MAHAAIAFARSFASTTEFLATELNYHGRDLTTEFDRLIEGLTVSSIKACDKGNQYPSNSRPCALLAITSKPWSLKAFENFVKSG
jgi:hypothetical protein